jgi:transglutaminase-like putative cysteine protease
MEYSVRHRTAYRYIQDVANSCHVAHLVPRDTPQQRVRDAGLAITPEPALQSRRLDYFGNVQHLFAVEHPYKAFEVVSESRVVVSEPAMLEDADDVPWENVREVLERADAAAARDAVQFLFDSPLTRMRSDPADYARESFTPSRGILSAAADLTSRVHRDFRYDTTVTDACTPVEKVFQIRAGVCQDLAHVALAALRSVGLAARYVSGYLLTSPPPGQPRLVGTDASHAWFAVWVPSCGWVDFDPTNNMRAGQSHITVAWGRDYSDVVPLGGVVTGGGEHVIEVGVDVLPAHPEGKQGH